jgi:hypothetical protein
METTTMATAVAKTTAREICDRPWMGSNTAHSGDLFQVQGRSVPFAGLDVRADLGRGIRFSGVATAPTTGYVSPRLEAPPV